MKNAFWKLNNRKANNNTMQLLQKIYISNIFEEKFLGEVNINKTQCVWSFDALVKVALFV